MLADLIVYYPSTSVDATDGMEMSKAVMLQLHDDYSASIEVKSEKNIPNTKQITSGKLRMGIRVSDSGYKDIYEIVVSSFKFKN